MTMLNRYRSLCISLSMLLLTAGCQTPPKEQRSTLFFPSPPARPRVQFLTWASGADEIEPQKGNFQKFVLGEEPTARRVIQKPYGLVARDGVVYVCDTKGLGLNRLDFRQGKYSMFGTSGPGRLRKPLNIATDALGYKFVVDSQRKQVVVFDASDQYVTAFNVPEPCRPVDLALHGNELFVLDNDETCQIVVMDRQTGTVLRSFGSSGGEPGQFKIPNSIAISPDGFLYVSDTHNWRIQKLTLEGEPVWERGKPGYLLGQFGRPRGIRVGPDGIIYVVDGATEIVQMFDGEGRTLMRFGGPGDIPGALGLPSTVAIDETSIPYFKQYVHEKFNVDYLIFVASQYGARLVSVYALGSFPEDYTPDEGTLEQLPAPPMEEGIGPAERPIPDEGDESIASPENAAARPTDSH